MSSRVVVFGLDNRSQGEFRAVCNRGWSLTGDPNVQSGGDSSVLLDADTASQGWMQLGRMVLIERPPLPKWAGMIDTPWSAKLPAKATLYSAEYLFHIRTPDASTMLKGTTGDIVMQMIEMVNAQEETYLRIGLVDDDEPREHTLDQRPFWEQLKALIERVGMEMRLRPEKENGQLIVYVDVLDHVGIETGFLFHDGENANMSVLDATIDNEIWNRAIGLGDQSTKAGRKQTAPTFDRASIGQFRMRSTNVQFDGVKEDATLLQYTQNFVQAKSRPILKMKLIIMDVGDAFQYVDLGNEAIFHAHDLRLPGGMIGFKGIGRMKALAYDEGTNAMGLLVEAEL